VNTVVAVSHALEERLRRHALGVDLREVVEAIATAPLRPKMTWDSLKTLTREP
jgi:hypothetical protein